MNKRIILVGPAAAGKDYLKRIFIKRGFTPDVSYTTRPKRVGEIDGQDYHYISSPRFFEMIAGLKFYEWCEHGDYLYGTGQFEWDNCDIFIMETHGISQISPEDRENCFIIYLNPDKDIRQKRLMERGWTLQNIMHRSTMDNEKFKNFKNYDMEITSPNF